MRRLPLALLLFVLCALTVVFYTSCGPGEPQETEVDTEPAPPPPPSGADIQPPSEIVELVPGRTVEVPVSGEMTFDRGLTFSAWFRIGHAGGLRRLVTWGDTLTLDVASSEHTGLHLRGNLTTDEKQFYFASRWALPTDRWIHVTISHQVQGPVQGHLAAGEYRPEVKPGGSITLAVGGVDDEPFSRSWNGIEAFGVVTNPKAPIVLGAGQSEVAVSNVRLLDHPTPVNHTVLGWLDVSRRMERSAHLTSVNTDTSLQRGDPVAMLLEPTFNCVGVYVLHAGAPAVERPRTIRYRLAGQTQWSTALPPVYDAVAGESRGSLLELPANTEVEVEFTLGDPARTLRGRTTTWSDDVPVGEVRYLPEHSKEQLTITDRGRPDAWIVYRGRPGSSATIDVGTDAAQAVLFNKAEYVLLENVTLRGGHTDGINVVASRHIRIRHCDISQFGIPGVVKQGLPKGLYVDKRGKPVNNRAGVRLGNNSRYVVVEGNLIHNPRARANSWANNHPLGPMGVLNTMQGGSNVIRYNDIIGSETHWWNDAIQGGGNSSPFGGPYRDTDIHGNLLTFANDDSTELDGGQINVRFWGNRVENCFAGLSGAPNVRGPAYVFGNLFVHLGDQRNMAGAGLKMGTGVYPSFGLTFLFHNTLTTPPERAMNAPHTAGMYARRPRKVRASAPIISANNLYGPGRIGYPALGGISHGGWFRHDMTPGKGISPEKARFEDLVEPPARFVDPAASDFRLAEGSAGLDAGLDLPGTNRRHQGKAPDLGAIEGAGQAASPYFPVRPWGLEVSPQRIELNVRPKATAQAVVTLDVPPSTGDTWQAISNAPWLSCTPGRGRTSEKPQPVNLTVDIEAAGLHRGAISFRTDRGIVRTVMVTVEATDESASVSTSKAD
ncbi:MAG: right-handed parallel beta-helix repeat-containing protein [Planctomycetota bacterium]